MNNNYKVYPIKVGTNYCYIIVDNLTNEAMIVDPAWSIKIIKDKLIELNAKLTTVLLTHSHYDHTNLVNTLVKQFGVNVFMSSEEIDFYDFRCDNLNPVDDMNIIKFGENSVKCLLTPGHTTGGMCYVLPDSIFTGDTIFIEGCGVCSEEGASAEGLYESVQRIKRDISSDVKVYPGHSYGKEPGCTMEYVTNNNIYFQLNDKQVFVDFRMRKEKMSKRIVFMFSGQGSQYFQMGKDLYDSHPVFRKWMNSLDNIVYEILGESILDKIYDEKKQISDSFDQLKYTHPAIFMIEYSLAQTLIEEGINPDYVLGSSLGELTSLAVADVLDVKDIMEGILKQTEIFEVNCEKAAMIAIIGDVRLYEETVLKESCEIAAINYSSHFVVSVKEQNISIVKRFLKEKNITSQVLPVSYGFHTELIDSARQSFFDNIKNIKYRDPSINVVSSLTGDLVDKISWDYMWHVVRDPIQFPKAIKKLEDISSNIYIDLGPSGTQASFVKNNLSENSTSEVYSVITPFNKGMENLSKLKDIKKDIKKDIAKDVEKERNDKGMIAYVFPGQGSQQKGMGCDLFDKYKELTEVADRVLGYSIKQLCLEDPNHELQQTQFTQPALFVVNALSYLKESKEGTIKPDYVAGHSLGEYSALFAAGVFDFETGLKLVKKRGELMSQAENGGMAAIVGFTDEKVSEILKRYNLTSIDIANFNTPTQIVISGLKDDIESAKPIFEAEGAKAYIVLKVSGAFHSRYMAEASEEFALFLKQFEFQNPNIPVIANVNARPYRNNELKLNIVNQITHSVRWTDSIRYLMGKNDIEIIQIGPGAVISGLVKTIKNEAEPLIVDEAEPLISEQIEIPQENENKTKNRLSITAESLGDKEFKKDYNLKYAYLAGGMYRGVSSKELVVRMGKAGMMGFLGTGGLEISQIEDAIEFIHSELDEDQAYGMNFISNINEPDKEERTIDLFMKYGINVIEASAFINMTPALVKYRIKGLKSNPDGTIISENRIIAKVSRPEIAEIFLSPPPDIIINKLLKQNKITSEEAMMSKQISMCDDLCVESDSGGHTDQGVAYTLMPAMLNLRDEMMKRFKYAKRVRVGAAGGIGTPEAALAAFVLGADFILTGSINQCTVEAGTSDAVKDLLQDINVQDTEYAPAGDMFEIGAKVQVVKKGVFFPARANKLYEVYKHYDSLDDIDEKTRNQIQDRYFRKSFEDIYDETKSFLSVVNPMLIERADKNPKYKMSLVFRWYFNYSTMLALTGNIENKVDYQINCGPAMGAFNQWVKRTDIENWRQRNVDRIAVQIMDETAKLLQRRFKSLIERS